VCFRISEYTSSLSTKPSHKYSAQFAKQKKSTSPFLIIL
jgi:hypothetical protein